jgi:hypothetical protein
LHEYVNSKIINIFSSQKNIFSFTKSRQKEL